MWMLINNQRRCYNGKNAFKKAISKLKPKEQACCSVEIEEKEENKKENTNKDQNNNKGCC